MTLQVSTFICVTQFLNSHIDVPNGQLHATAALALEQELPVPMDVRWFDFTLSGPALRSPAPATSALPTDFPFPFYSYVLVTSFGTNFPLVEGCCAHVTSPTGWWMDIDRSATGVGACWRHSNTDCSEQQQTSDSEELQVCSNTLWSRVSDFAVFHFHFVSLFCFKHNALCSV